MTLYVFAGPTIAVDEARTYVEACYLPPVARGDVYRVARKGARAIAIIDGYFEGVPSVWHKEILWAIGQGIHVLGAASMGALRAAELHSFGMQGVGSIFEAYRDGLLEDDDEVAVVHGPPEVGFLTLSDALVDIRATLNRAETSGVIRGETKQRLTEQAKSTFYKDRSYERLIHQGAEMDLPVAELDALRAWLPSGRVLQKREDAIMLLNQIASAEKATDSKPDSFHFQQTENWAELVAEIESESGSALSEVDVLIMEELRLQPAAYLRARRGAVLRRLAVEQYERAQGRPVSPERTRRASKEFRLARNLFTQKDLGDWLAEHDLSPSSFDELLSDEATIEAIEQSMASSMGSHILNGLRLDGDYRQYACRARDKRKVLTSLPDAESSGGGAATVGLVAWFFEKQLGQPIPDDLEAFFSRLDFRDTTAFMHALQREYTYLSCSRWHGDS